MYPQDPTTWMWLRACEWMQEAERLQRQFFRLQDFRDRRPAWEPPVDMLETEKALRIVVALPGVTARRLEVAMDGAVLVISGDRPTPLGPETIAIHRLEIPHGRFERRIPLPAEQFELEQSELADGCLVLVLRKLA